MKIIVTSEVTEGDYQKVSDITWPIIQKYCDLHGYEFHPKVVVNPERDSIWERVNSLQDALKNSDWAVHVDADWMPTHFGVKLESFIENNKCVITSEADYNGRMMINDGFLMMSDSMLSFGLLGHGWKMLYPDGGIFCFQDYLDSVYRNSDDPIRESFKVMPQDRCNSFLWAEYSGSESTPGNWQEGHFALHLPGMTTEKRVLLLNEYKERIVR